MGESRSILQCCANCSLSLFDTKAVRGKRRVKKQNQIVREIIIKDQGQVVTVSSASSSSDESSTSALPKRAKASTTTRRDPVKFKKTMVKVHTALTKIYKLNMLSELTSYVEDLSDGENEEEIGLCQPCAVALTDLYMSFIKFDHLRKDSYLTNKIEKLNDVCAQIESTWNESQDQSQGQQVDDNDDREADTTTTSQPEVIDVDDDDDEEVGEEEEEKEISNHVVQNEEEKRKAHQLSDKDVSQQQDDDDESDGDPSILDSPEADNEAQEDDNISIVENPMEIVTQEEEDDDDDGFKGTSKNTHYDVAKRIEWQLANAPSIVIEKLDDKMHEFSKHPNNNIQKDSPKIDSMSTPTDSNVLSAGSSRVPKNKNKDLGPLENEIEMEVPVIHSPAKITIPQYESSPSSSERPSTTKSTRQKEKSQASSMTSRSSPSPILTGRRRTRRINYTDQLTTGSRETSPTMDGNESSDPEHYVVVPKKKKKIVETKVVTTKKEKKKDLTEKEKKKPTETEKIKSTEKSSDPKPSVSSTTKPVSSEQKKERPVEKKVSKTKEPSTALKGLESEKATKDDREKEIKKETFAKETMKKRIRETLEFRLTEVSDEEKATFPLKNTPLYLANKIEEELTLCYGGPNDQKWKSKYLSIYSNLKDSKNSLFREILQGNIEPKKLVRMEAVDMASKELAAWRESENKKTLKIMEKDAFDKLVERKKLMEKGPYEDAVDASDVIGVKDIPSPEDLEVALISDPIMSKNRSSHASSSSSSHHDRSDRHHKKDKKQDKENRHSKSSRSSNSTSSSSKDKDKHKSSSRKSSDESKKSDPNNKNNEGSNKDKKKDKESSSQREEVAKPKLCLDQKEKDKIPISDDDDDDDINIIGETPKKDSPSSKTSGGESPFFRFSQVPRRPSSVSPKPIEKDTAADFSHQQERSSPSVQEKDENKIGNAVNGHSSSKSGEKPPLLRPFILPRSIFNGGLEKKELEKSVNTVKKNFFYKEKPIGATEEEDEDDDDDGDDDHDDDKTAHGTTNKNDDKKIIQKGHDSEEDKSLEDLETRELISLLEDTDGEENEKMTNGVSSSQSKSFIDKKDDDQVSVEDETEEDEEDDTNNGTKPSSSSGVKGQENTAKNLMPPEPDDSQEYLIIDVSDTDTDDDDL